MGVTRIESNRNRDFGLKMESKSIENRNLEIVTSLTIKQDGKQHEQDNKASTVALTVAWKIKLYNR